MNVLADLSLVKWPGFPSSNLDLFYDHKKLNSTIFWPVIIAVLIPGLDYVPKRYAHLFISSSHFKMLSIGYVDASMSFMSCLMQQSALARQSQPTDVSFTPPSHGIMHCGRFPALKHLSCFLFGDCHDLVLLSSRSQ